MIPNGNTRPKASHLTRGYSGMQKNEMIGNAEFGLLPKEQKISIRNASEVPRYKIVHGLPLFMAFPNGSRAK